MVSHNCDVGAGTSCGGCGRIGDGFVMSAYLLKTLLVGGLNLKP